MIGADKDLGEEEEEEEEEEDLQRSEGSFGDEKTGVMGVVEGATAHILIDMIYIVIGFLFAYCFKKKMKWKRRKEKKYL